MRIDWKQFRSSLIASALHFAIRIQIMKYGCILACPLYMTATTWTKDDGSCFSDSIFAATVLAVLRKDPLHHSRSPTKPSSPRYPIQQQWLSQGKFTCDQVTNATPSKLHSKPVSIHQLAPQIHGLTVFGSKFINSDNQLQLRGLTLECVAVILFQH